jgi:hypothetical protein
MPITNGGVRDVQNTIIAVMAKEYPNAQLIAQEQNLLDFREVQGTFLGNANCFYTFTISPKWETNGSTSIKVTMKVTFLDTEVTNDTHDHVLIFVKALHDGYYYYGFEHKGNKITKLYSDSPALLAGLREGDRIDTINGYKVSKVTTLGRATTCNVVTFKTKEGKSFRVEGKYCTPEKYRQFFFQQH